VYLAYMDDSDTKQKIQQWQVMSAVIVKDTIFHELELVMGLIVEDCLPPEKIEHFVEFHACELYGGYGVFEGIKQEERFRIIKRLLDLLEHCPVIYGAVDLRRLGDVVYASADPVDIAFRICATGVEQWLTQHLEAAFQENREHDDLRHTMALLIADDCDSKTKTSMQRSFRRMRKPLHPPEYKSGPLRHVHDDMYFGASKFSVGIQLADLCSYFIAKHLEGDPGSGDPGSEGFYGMIEKHIVHYKIEPDMGV
jgi:hypothetical protein